MTTSAFSAVVAVSSSNVMTVLEFSISNAYQILMSYQKVHGDARGTIALAVMMRLKQSRRKVNTVLTVQHRTAIFVLAVSLMTTISL